MLRGHAAARPALPTLKRFRWRSCTAISAPSVPRSIAPLARPAAAGTAAGQQKQRGCRLLDEMSALSCCAVLVSLRGQNARRGFQHDVHHQAGIVRDSPGSRVHTVAPDERALAVTPSGTHQRKPGACRCRCRRPRWDKQTFRETMWRISASLPQPCVATIYLHAHGSSSVVFRLICLRCSLPSRRHTPSTSHTQRMPEMIGPVER